MQTIAVVISDENAGRRSKLEQLLHGEPGIRIVAKVNSNENDMAKGRRLIPRANTAAMEERVALVCRLKPRILFADMQQCIDADYPILVSLRDACPQTQVILLADDSEQQENQVMQALASGARGYLNLESDSSHLSRAVHAVDRGEVWVPRKMLGKIMGQISLWYQASSRGGDLDPAG
jgi:DNA-binding NarL/FixJ family response regulator